MTEEKLNRLFELSKEQPSEIALSEVTQWVSGAVVSVGFFAGLKILFTKKLAMIFSISTLVTGVTVTTAVLSGKAPEKTPPVKHPVASVVTTPASSPEQDSVVAELLAKTVNLSAILAGEAPPEEQPESFERLFFPVRSLYPDTTQRAPGAVEHPTEAKEFDGNFDCLKINGFVHCKIVQGDKCSYTINIPGGDCEVGLHHSLNGNVLELNSAKKNDADQLIITMPFLKRLEVNGFCSIEMENMIDAEDLVVEVNGFSEAQINSDAQSVKLEMNGESKMSFKGNVQDMDAEISGWSKFDFKGDTESLRLEANGGSKLELKGTTKDADIELNGQCEISGKSFSVGKLIIEMNGDCKGEIDISTELSAELNGTSKLVYTGNPNTLKQDLSGRAKLITTNK